MKKRAKNSRKKVLKITIAIIVGILLCVAVFLLATNLAARKSQLDSLNSVSDDLRQLHTEITTVLTSNIEAVDFRKVCYQSSAKFGLGSIRCGSEGRITVNKLMPYESQKQHTMDLIEQSVDFGYKMAEDVHDDKTGAIKGFVIHFVHDKTNTICNLIMELEQYETMCLQTVPDFLPGYTVER